MDEELKSTSSGSRNAMLVRSAFTSGLARVITILVPIVTVPVSLGALGVQAYGAWAAALALTSLATFGDLGMGAGLVTALPAALARSDTTRARRLVSTAYAAVGAFVSLVIVALVSVSFFVPWGGIVGIDAGERVDGVDSIILVTFLAFALNIIASLVYRVQQAMQQISRAYAWQSGTSVLGLLAILVAASMELENAWFIAVAAFASPLGSIIYTVVFFGLNRDGRAVMPHVGCFRWLEFRFLTGIGTKFLLISVLMAASLGIDTWIIAQSGDLANAAQFAVASRVFGMVGALVLALAAPLWPMVANALSLNDLSWAKHSARKMTIVLVVLSVLASGVALAFAPTVFTIWLGSDHTPSMLLLVGLASWNIVQSLVSPAFMVQNAAKVLAPQTAGYFLLLILIPIKWYVVQTGEIELVPWVTVLGYVLIIWPAAFIGYRAALKRAVPSPDASEGELL